MINAFERECAAAHVCNDDKNIAEKLLSDSRPVRYASTPVDLNPGNDLAHPELLEQMRAMNKSTPGPSGAKGSEGVEPAPKVNPLSKRVDLKELTTLTAQLLSDRRSS